MKILINEDLQALTNFFGGSLVVTIMLTEVFCRKQSPVLDVKPYTPSLDRVETPQVPEWCGHWPKNVESSDDFDWESEFNF